MDDVVGLQLVRGLPHHPDRGPDRPASRGPHHATQLNPNQKIGSMGFDKQDMPNP